MATPQMMPPAPPAKKISPIVWILIAVFGLMLFAGVLFGIGAFLFVRKVKQVAGGNPASIVRMLASMNPDVEVVKSDEAAGTVTIKDKKTGKVVTMNFDDVKNGKIVFQDDGKNAVTIQARGKDGQGSIDIKSPDGTAHLGSGSGKVPAWVPAYPGSTPQGVYSAQSDKEDSGSYAFTTTDSLADVSKHYQDALKGAGFKVTSMNTGESGAMLTAKTDGDKRTLLMTIGSDGKETNVSVIFKESK